MSEIKEDITRNPFTVPDGYFESLEDRVRERIHRPATPFSKVTPLIYDGPAAPGDPIMAMIEEGYLESSFIYAYFEEIDVDEAFTYSLENTVTIDGEIEEDLESTLTEDDMWEHLDSQDTLDWTETGADR